MDIDTDFLHRKAGPDDQRPVPKLRHQRFLHGAVQRSGISPDGKSTQGLEGIGLIRANAANFAVKNVTVIQAEAPEGLADLPEADAILIGGSGGNLQEILTEVTPKLKASGRLVLNCITVQTLMQCIEFMRENSDTYIYEAIQVQVTRLQQVGTYDMAKANNPIYIVTCWKK